MIKSGLDLNSTDYFKEMYISDFENGIMTKLFKD